MPHRFVSRLLALWLVFGSPAGAAIDLSSSRIDIRPSAPKAGQVVHYQLRLHNADGTAVEGLSLRIDWPQAGYLVGSEGLDKATEVDPLARQIRTLLDLPAGATTTLGISILSPRDAAGQRMNLSVQLAQFQQGYEHWLHAGVALDSPPPRDALAVGGVLITRAGLWVLALLLAAVTLWWLLWQVGQRRQTASARHRLGAASAALAITVACGFWALFASMAWRDYQSLSIWPETRCEILGGRLSAQASSRRSTSSTTPAGRDSSHYVPELGLRYRVDGELWLSSGFDTGSRLGIGSRGGREAELSRWMIGSQVPCWYNPQDPADVVVLRGFGGAYLFALFPLPLFWLGMRGLRRRD